GAENNARAAMMPMNCGENRDGASASGSTAVLAERCAPPRSDPLKDVRQPVLNVHTILGSKEKPAFLFNFYADAFPMAHDVVMIFLEERLGKPAHAAFYD